jgi:hypothetical protein
MFSLYVSVVGWGYQRQRPAQPAYHVLRLAKEEFMIIMLQIIPALA